MSRTLLVVSCVLPLVVAAAVWYPVVQHYYVPAVRLSEASVDDFVNRPSDVVLERLGRQFLGVRPSEATSFPPNSPEGRLSRAGLFDVAADLARFERTGDARLFEAITEAVISFCRDANRRFAYDDFLWNDHAIASRVFVLAKFWRHYRKHPSFNAEGATQLLEQVAKGVQFLARDDHFTYWTNHGVMQSIALLHAANSFPGLPERDRFVDIALNRLADQFEFFVSDSGWIMEHSAGYQEFGVNLLGTLFVEMELLGREPPHEWRIKASESKRVLQWLMRPDGSVPNFGDSGTKVGADDLVTNCELISPGVRQWAEGYLVAWDVRSRREANTCAQTTIVWSSFVSNAHKRPNELSVHYWVDGIDYLRSSGYWPYGDLDRAEAIGWRGSNAPHYTNERDDGVYTVSQSALCVAEGFTFIDLERNHGASSQSVRRQVVDLGLTGLLVIDSGDTPTTDTRESVWRIDTRLTVVGPGGATIRAGSPFEGKLHAMQITGPSAAVDLLSGAYAREGYPLPTKFSAVAADERLQTVPTYIVTSGAAEPTLIVLTASDSDDTRGLFRLSLFDSPERWKVEGEAGLVVERNGRIVAVADAENGSAAECNAGGGVVDDDGIRRMEGKFYELADRYPVFKPWVEYRSRVTLVVVALLLGQLLFLGVLSSTARRKLRPYLGGALTAGWLGLGGYIVLVYLAQ